MRPWYALSSITHSLLKYELLKTFILSLFVLFFVPVCFIIDRPGKMKLWLSRRSALLQRNLCCYLKILRPKSPSWIERSPTCSTKPSLPSQSPNQNLKTRTPPALMVKLTGQTLRKSSLPKVCPVRKKYWLFVRPCICIVSAYIFCCCFYLL